MAMVQKADELEHIDDVIKRNDIRFILSLIHISEPTRPY